MNCDYCSENLPLWHRREPDEYGLEGAQFVPCAKQPPTLDQVLWVLDALIEAQFTPAEVKLVKDWLL